MEYFSCYHYTNGFKCHKNSLKIQCIMYFYSFFIVILLPNMIHAICTNLLKNSTNLCNYYFFSLRYSLFKAVSKTSSCTVLVLILRTDSNYIIRKNLKFYHFFKERKKKHTKNVFS